MRIPMPSKPIERRLTYEELEAQKPHYRLRGMTEEEFREFKNDVVAFNTAWKTQFKINKFVCQGRFERWDPELTGYMQFLAWWEFKDADGYERSACWTRNYDWETNTLVDQFSGDWTPDQSDDPLVQYEETKPRRLKK